MAIRIYTKTGDKGKTALIGGIKVSKSSIRIESYGTLDELSSHLGMVRDQIIDERSRETVKAIQNTLFTIGSLLACAPGKELSMQLPELQDHDVKLLESEIDEMESKLPVMKNFILPGGHIAVSAIHIARCVCRRGERLCVAMLEQNEPIDPLIIQYINRLSDYLFVLARFTASMLEVKEEIWILPRMQPKHK